jgi:VanZ family protein
LLWLLAVVIGSLVSGTSPVIRTLSRLQVSDKIQHLLAYTMLVFLPAVHERRAVAILAWIGVIAVGVGLEFVQLWSGRREFEVNDIIADAVGASLGAVLGFSLGRRVGAIVEQYAGRSVYADRR